MKISHDEKRYRAELRNVLSRDRHQCVDRTLVVGGETLSVADAVIKNQRIGLIGDPGSGKTTLLRMLAVSVAEEPKNTAMLPFFVHLRHYDTNRFGGDLPLFISTSALPSAPAHVTTSTLKNGRALVLLDGLDELIPEQRYSSLSSFCEWIASYPQNIWVISTRPVAAQALPKNLVFVHVPPLAESELHALAAKLLPANMTAGFMEAVSSLPVYKESVSSPLFLTLLAKVFQERALLPMKASDFYATLVDMSLRRWDKQRGISKGDRYLDAATTERLLSVLALRLSLAQRRDFRLEDWLAVCKDSGLSDRDIKSVAVQTLLEDMARSCFVVPVASEKYAFCHLSFQEYLASLALMRMVPSEVKRVLRELSHSGIAVFYSEIARDPTPYVELLVESGRIDDAVKFVEDNNVAEVSRLRLVSLIASRLGVQSAQSISDDTQPQETRIPEKKTSLGTLWNSCFSEQSPYEKGVALERFAHEFFDNVFKVVETRRTTDYGEIDLVCEVREVDPFWIRWTGDFFVECKNRDANTPVNTINEFLGKALATHTPLCFIFTTSFFTDSALNRIGRAWSDISTP